jgi:hypothetical protein
LGARPEDVSVTERDDDEAIAARKGDEAMAARDDGEIAANDDPPVVARLVVEIRSDGRRTIARGALEDRAAGERVVVQAEGRSPIELALSLARTIFSLPQLARGTARALLAGKPRRNR